MTKENIAYGECIGEVLKVVSRKHLLTVPAAKTQFPFLTTTRLNSNRTIKLFNILIYSLRVSYLVGNEVNGDARVRF